MEPTLSKELRDIAASLRIMKIGLHWWDDVDNQIDGELKQVEAELQKPSVDSETVEGFRQDRERLWKLTAQERSENIENAETLLPGLKVTAVTGLAVPAVVLGAVYAAPALIKVGAAASVPALILPAASRSLGFLNRFFWGNSWRTRLPWAAAYASSLIAAAKSYQEKAAPFRNPQQTSLPVLNVQDPRYRQSTADYIRLAHHILSQPLNPRSLGILFEHARRSDNPEIQGVFSQLFHPELEQPGVFTTMYRDSENFCLNFTQAVQELPCRLGSRDFMGASGIANQPVANNFPIPPRHGERLGDFIKEASRFLVNRPRLNPRQAVALLTKTHGSPTLVNGILERLYKNLNLPEGVAAVNYILLNVFMRSEAISADAKLFYAGLLRASLEEYQQAMKEKIASLRPAVASTATEPQIDTRTGEFYLKSAVQNPAVVQAFLEELRGEKESLIEALSAFEAWGLKHWSKDFHKRFQKIVRKMKGEMEEVYGDYERIRYHLFFDRNYLKTAEADFWTLLGTKKDGQIIADGYMVRSRSISDVWRSELSAEGAFWGGLAGSFGLRVGRSPAAQGLLRAGSLWQKAVGYVPWIAAGLLAYPNISAVVSAGVEEGPLPRSSLTER
ncbi:MAG: hypothetical protein HY466_03950 [Deltaproteobacteria bacterium]|nr:hypothetical protein [Deltaproteobacteria bacterium]